jgi:hypothetical protein
MINIARLQLSWNNCEIAIALAHESRSDPSLVVPAPFRSWCLLCFSVCLCGVGCAANRLISGKSNQTAQRIESARRRALECDGKEDRDLRFRAHSQMIRNTRVAPRHLRRESRVSRVLRAILLRCVYLSARRTSTSTGVAADGGKVEEDDEGGSRWTRMEEMCERKCERCIAVSMMRCDFTLR